MRPTIEEEFLRAFDEYADALLRHASFRLSNRERAADLTQETFLKVWDYVQGGGAVRQYKSFLYRVLNNLIIDEYRKSKDESLDKLLEDDAPAAAAAVATGSRAETEERLDDALLAAQVRERMRELPEGYRVALTLRYVDGLSPKEIAVSLGITENAASVRIHRAAARLKELCASLPHP